MHEIRLFGPPGTGKTTKLTELVASHVTQHGQDEILLSSFTKTAAQELRSRNTSLPDSQVGTLHAHAYRLLGSPKLVTDRAAITAWNDSHPHLRLSGGGGDLNTPWEDLPDHEDGDWARREYGRFRSLQVPEAAWPAPVALFAQSWETFKQSTNLLDFHDLLDRCLTERLCPSASIGFFDEVQDFSPQELAVVRQWGAGMSTIYLAGDDDQAIMCFRGALPDHFLSPALPPDQKLFLTQSYRVPEAIHAKATHWVEQIHPREPKTYLPRPVKGRVEVLPATLKYPEALLPHLERILGEYATVMVLASCAYLLDPLIALLRQEGLLFSNRWRPQAGKWNPIRVGRGVSCGDRVKAFLRPQATHYGDAYRIWNYHDLHQALDVLQTKDVLSRGAKTQLKQRAAETPMAPVAMEDLEAWVPHDDAQEGLLTGDLAWYRSKLLTSAQKTMGYAITVVTQRGLPSLNAAQRLTVGTIHSVKGGEADAVILFPDLSRQGWEHLHEPGGLMEARRVFYVGMTRAKEALFLGQTDSVFHLEGL